MIKKWDIVGSLWDIVGWVFDDCTEYDSPCQGCSHFTSEWWSDTGTEYGCDLLNMDWGTPEDCPGFQDEYDKEIKRAMEREDEQGI